MGKHCTSARCLRGVSSPVWMTVWHFNWTAPKHAPDTKMVQWEEKNMMFICLFQNGHTSKTQWDRERSAVRRSTLHSRQPCTRQSLSCVSPNVSGVGPNLSNLFLSALTGTTYKKKLRELEGGGNCLNQQNRYCCKMVAMQNVSTSQSKSRSLALVCSFASNTVPLQDSSKGRAE